jgi:hypothetical protein
MTNQREKHQEACGNTSAAATTLPENSHISARDTLEATYEQVPVSVKDFYKNSYKEERSALREFLEKEQKLLRVLSPTFFSDARMRKRKTAYKEFSYADRCALLSLFYYDDFKEAEEKSKQLIKAIR